MRPEESPPNDRVYRFAGFELLPAAGELRNGDSTLRLQDKPLRLLLALLDNPQTVVTREQLRERIWGARTVVEYDQGINAAMLKVRDALGDSASKPRFIETVAKRGYRLLVPVTVVEPAMAAPDPPVPSPPPAPPPRRWRVPLLGTLAVVALVALYIVVTAPRDSGFHSLAVLPLQDLSPGGGHEYFADGITEELTTNLAQTLPLRVISRTSAMQYKRTRKTARQIGRELGVEAIVEGSIARSGDSVSVTVQLIDARHDKHLWAEKYERKVEDILALEAELSQAIASRIGGTLAQHRNPARAARRVDPQVYEWCLLGRFHWNKRTAGDFAKAQNYFEQAIARDPDYAPAHAGLADVFAMQPFYGAARYEDNSPIAIAAARRALDLDATLAEAHATLGLVWISTKEWKNSAAEFRRAIELNPNYATAHHWYAYYLRFANRLEEACAELEMARKLDPLSAIINTDLGETLNSAGRYAEARTSLKRALELSPGLARAHAFLSVTELATGHENAAIEHAQRALALDPRGASTLAHAGFAFAVAGNEAEAQRLLAALKKMAADDINVSMYAAMIESGLGRRDDALATLESQARAPHSIVLQGIQTWYAFRSIRAEPRFQALLSQSW